MHMSGLVAYPIHPFNPPCSRTPNLGTAVSSAKRPTLFMPDKSFVAKSITCTAAAVVLDRGVRTIPRTGSAGKMFFDATVRVIQLRPSSHGVSDTVHSPKRRTYSYMKSNAGDGREPSPTLVLKIEHSGRWRAVLPPALGNTQHRGCLLYTSPSPRD